MKSHVLVTGPIPSPWESYLREHGLEPSIFDGPAPLPAGELSERIENTAGLICFLTDRITDALLSRARHLRAISVCAAGYDNVDLAACNRRKIPVSHTVGVLTEATADLTWALILAVTRRVLGADRFVRDSKYQGWRSDLFLGMGLQRKVLGIVGYGRIGHAVARRAHAFGMRVMAVSHRKASVLSNGDVTWATLEEVVAESDIVSLHCPLTEETRGLFGSELLSKMKKGAFLINTARGPIVNEAALVKALSSGHLAGAGLDVFEREPIFNRELGELENVVLLPHIGSATVETRDLMAEVAVKQLCAMLSGDSTDVLFVPGAEARP